MARGNAGKAWNSRKTLLRWREVACSHPPTVAMNVIYLDQNAVSYLAFSEPGSVWWEIRLVLEKKCDEGKSICPMPMETWIESAPCDRKQRVAIEHLFERVALGARFCSFVDILVDETLSLVRPNDRPTGFAKLGSGWAARDDLADNAKRHHAATRQQMADRVSSHSYSAEMLKLSPDDIFRSLCVERCEMFARDLSAFVESPAPLETYECGGLMIGLIERGLTKSEAFALMDDGKLRKWLAIPVNFFDLKIGSWWDHDQIHAQRPKYHPNDEIDRLRAAVALSYSNIFITDPYLADLCRRSKISRVSQASTVSTKQHELILEGLKALN